MTKLANKRWWVVGMTGVAIAAIVIAKSRHGDTGAGDVPTFMVQRGTLQINVLQGGEIRALENYGVKSEIEIPYSHIYENTFTFGAADYAPLVKGVPALVTRRVDGQHPASRLLWFFRTQNDLRTGRRWRYSPDPDNEYYVGQSLVIAGRDRETFFTPSIWNYLTHHAKEDRDPGAGIGEMSWNLGDIRGRLPPFDRQPEGSVNFTTADRPTLYISLATAPDDTILGSPSTEMTAIVDTWSLYRIEKDRGFLKFGN
jgi:hypothetical protein